MVHVYEKTIEKLFKFRLGTLNKKIWTYLVPSWTYPLMVLDGLGIRKDLSDFEFYDFQVV